MSGLKLAAVYGFPPSRLGYCGSGTKKNLDVINEFLQGNYSLSNKVREILCTFEAAYSYYRLIARANSISNPFDQRVVEAYWLGNEFLEKVNLADIKQMIRSDFVRPNLLTKKQAEEKISKLRKGAVPNHLFHVLFIGSITGRVKLAGKLIDVCRVGWGQVKVIKKNKIVVSYRPILKKNVKYVFGPTIDRSLIWEKSFVPSLQGDDFLSFHWGRICQRLNSNQLKDLQKYSSLNVKVFNEQRR